jgi:hypothetical protein
MNRTFRLPLVAALLGAAASPALGQEPGAEASARLSIDARARVVTISMGPFTIPAGGPGGHRHTMGGHETPAYRVTWPVRGWFRGYEVEVVDSNGVKMSRRFLHHLSMVNLGRRQLIYPAFERLLGASQEVDRFMVPKSIGVPMEPGMELATFVGWHNSTTQAIPGVTVVIRMQYMPPNMTPRPLDVHLLYMDVAYTVGRTDAYTLPGGPSSRSYEFTLPVGGRILAAGGHLHDFGKFIRLEDAESGKILLNLPARTDSLGQLKSVPTRLLGVTGPGLKLKANHRYRVRADYDKPGADSLKQGAMALMVAAFVPDDPHRWPPLDIDDPGIQSDLSMLDGVGRGGSKRLRATTGTAAADSAHEHMHDQ